MAGVSFTSYLIVVFGFLGLTNTDVALSPLYGPNLPSRNAKGSSNVGFNANSYKLRLRRETAEHDDEMRLWDQMFTNVLATANTSQWMHLREVFERVEEELHKAKSSGNTSLNDENMIISPDNIHHPKHPKFSYHRVPGPFKGMGRPIAGVTIDLSPNKDGMSTSRSDNTEGRNHIFLPEESEHTPWKASHYLDSNRHKHDGLSHHHYNHHHNHQSSRRRNHRRKSIEHYERWNGDEVEDSHIIAHNPIHRHHKKHHHSTHSHHQNQHNHQSDHDF